MDAQLVFILVCILAVVYVAFSSLMTQTLGNRKRVSEIQADMKRINEEHMKALKGGDKEALSRAEKAQGERLPALLNESLQLQFKPLIPSLLIFFLFFYYFIPQIAPDANDDAHFTLFDDGIAAHCDAIANDSIYSSCYTISQNGADGTWIAAARAVKTGSFIIFASEDKISENSTTFTVGSPIPSQVLPALPQSASRGQLTLSTGKPAYSRGETLYLHAKVSGEAPEKVLAYIDLGTRYWINSSIDIPFLGKELHTGSLFILILLVSSLLLQGLLALDKKVRERFKPHGGA